MIEVASLLDPQGYISSSTVLLMKKKKIEFHDVDWHCLGKQVNGERNIILRFVFRSGSNVP